MTSNLPSAVVPVTPAAVPGFVGRLSSRKFLLALATLAAASVLLWFGHIEALVWRDVVIATVGAYITANVTQRVMTGRTPAP